MTTNPSTSEFGSGTGIPSQAPGGRSPGEYQVHAHGFDVEALTRLANQFFNATSTPVDPQVASAPAQIDSLAGSSPRATATPAQAQPASGWGTPTSATGWTAPAGASGFSSAPTSTAVPTALASPSMPTTLPNQQATPPGIPGEAELRSLLSASAMPIVPLQPSAIAETAPAAFYFLNEPARAPATAGRSAAPPAMPGDPWTPAVPLVPHGVPPFDIERVRRDFPILEERVNGRRLVWLDNAATTQKPRQVIDRLRHFYEHENSNIHRAAHTLAARATDAYEGARKKVRTFLGAVSDAEIVFTRGATEAINLVAHAWGPANLKPDDEIVVTHLEHHANIVPWQQVCAKTGAKLRVAPVDSTGQIILDDYARLLNPRTRLVSITQVSNALGTVTPAKRMTELAHAAGALVLIDGAQAVSHMPINVQTLGCDWYVFSGHKVFAPTGIGVLYGRQALLDSMPPWQGGGNMIADVTFDHTVYQPAPFRFEAGTGNIADAVGLGAAIAYLDTIGMENISRHEQIGRAHV